MHDISTGLHHHINAAVNIFKLVKIKFDHWFGNNESMLGCDHFNGMGLKPA